MNYITKRGFYMRQKTGDAESSVSQEVNNTGPDYNNQDDFIKILEQNGIPPSFVNPDILNVMCPYTIGQVYILSHDHTIFRSKCTTIAGKTFNVSTISSRGAYISISSENEVMRVCFINDHETRNSSIVDVADIEIIKSSERQPDIDTMVNIMKNMYISIPLNVEVIEKDWGWFKIFIEIYKRIIELNSSGLAYIATLSIPSYIGVNKFVIIRATNIASTVENSELIAILTQLKHIHYYGIICGIIRPIISNSASTIGVFYKDNMYMAQIQWRLSKFAFITQPDFFKDILSPTKYISAAIKDQSGLIQLHMSQSIYSEFLFRINDIIYQDNMEELCALLRVLAIGDYINVLTVYYDKPYKSIILNLITERFISVMKYFIKLKQIVYKDIAEYMVKEEKEMVDSVLDVIINDTAPEKMDYISVLAPNSNVIVKFEQIVKNKYAVLSAINGIPKTMYGYKNIF